jgi:hypothetical protein
LHVVHSVVELALRVIAEAIKPLLKILRRLLHVIHSIIEPPLHTVPEAIDTGLNVVGYLLGFADAATGPLSGVGGEVRGGLFEAGSVAVPRLFCERICE